MLHILFNSPFKINTDELYLLLSPQDSIIALQDGILIIFENNLSIFCIKNSIKLYLLQDHVLKKGMMKHVSKDFNLVNNVQFLQLTKKYSKYISW